MTEPIPLNFPVRLGNRIGRYVGRHDSQAFIQFDDESVLETDVETNQPPLLICSVDADRVEVLSNHDPAAYPYIWYVRTRFPDRKGQRCRVVTRGARNSALIEFQDGFKLITSRNYIRKAGAPRSEATHG